MEDNAGQITEVLRKPPTIITGFRNLFSIMKFLSIQAAAENVRLTQFRGFGTWNMNFSISMTCLLIHCFKYLLTLQQHQIKTKAQWSKNAKKKKIKLLLKKNINPVATLVKGKLRETQPSVSFTMARKQEGNHASFAGVPWLHGQACAHASLLPAQGQECVTVTTAINFGQESCMSAHSKDLQIPEDCLLGKVRTFLV